ncbi:MAG: hypothetical protein AB1697_08655 [Pseudomonadota bacterium]
MLPHYHLPPRQRTAGTINPDHSPDQVGSWLAKLPLADAAEAATKLGRFLGAFSRIDLPAQHRSQLANLLKTSAWHLAERLRQELADHPLPLTEAGYRKLELCQTLLGELANSQKLLILATLHQGHALQAAPRLADLLLTLSRQMLLAFQCHTPLPAGLWLDLHQTHLCALQRGLAETAVSNDQDSLANHYKALLLLALADPYQFTAEELSWAHDLARRLAPLGTITPADGSKTPLAPFYLHPRRDEPPLSLARHQAATRHALLFDTADIARQLAQLGNTIRQQRPAPDLPPAQDWPAYRTLLNKLKLRWGASRHRLIQRRRPTQTVPYEIALGAAQPEQPAGLPALDDGPSSALACRTLNDSAGGLALECSGQLPRHIDVGELIALRQQQGRHWQIGVIRWFQQPQPERLAFGLQLLASRAEPTRLRDPATQQPVSGLLLRSLNANGAEKLLLRQGLARTDLPVLLEQADGARPVVLKPLTEVAAGIALFRIEPA